MEPSSLYDRLVEESISRPFPKLMPRRPAVLLRPGRADVLVGMRRSGKTYGLWETLAAQKGAGVPRDRLLFLNMEDDRLGQPTAQTLDGLLEAYFRLVPQARQKGCTICLDEVQAAAGWERFVRRLLDSEPIHVLLSGSSAKLLSTEIATSLRGRAWRVEVFPYDFRESLRHRGMEPKTGPIGKEQRSLLAHQARQYLQIGGFPEVQDEGSAVRRQLLRDYVDVVLLRDIVERHRVSNLQALRHLTRRLLADPAGLFSVNRFFNDLRSLGLKCTKDLLYSYFDHLCDAYLVHAVALDTRSERERRSNPRKIYANDPGLALGYLRHPQVPWGALLETWVFLHLRRTFGEVAYVRTPRGYEVDFVVRDDMGEEALVQVCTSLDEPDTRKRELRALQDAHAAYPRATRTLVTLDAQETVKTETGPIHVVPIWRWTLAGKAVLF